MPNFVHEGITYHYVEWGTRGEKVPYIFLHGFAQSAQTWDEIASGLAATDYVVALDLVGHGQSDRPNDPLGYSIPSQTEALNALFDYLQLNKVVLVGYSMGGRIAAKYAVDYPERIDRLVLESAGLGPQTDEEWESMHSRDEALVARIRKSSLEGFFDYWENLPLFKTQKELPEETQKRILQQRLQNDLFALAFTVEEAGQHTMFDLRPSLFDAAFPVQYIAGTKDARYSKIAEHLVDTPITTTFLEAGHNTHLEAPVDFLQAIAAK